MTHTHVLPKEGIRHNRNKKQTEKSATETNNQCSSLPEKYEKPYGWVLYALETSCYRSLSKDERSFMMGASETLLVQCKYPSIIRIRIVPIVYSSAWLAGRKYAESLGCTQQGNKLAKNIVKYLK